jgi:hypothetical protein
VSNWVLFPGDSFGSDRYLRAELKVINKVLREAPYESSIDWNEQMDIMVSKILQNDPEASGDEKLRALLKEINARTVLLFEKYCE